MLTGKEYGPHICLNSQRGGVCTDSDCSCTPGLHIVNEDEIRKEDLLLRGAEIAESSFPNNQALVDALRNDPEALAIIAHEMNG